MSPPLLEALRARLTVEPEAVRGEIEHHVLAGRDERGGHTEWGLLCEEAGLMGLAFREFQLAIRDDRNDAVAGFRLAEHYRERGDSLRAAALLERLLNLDPVRDEWLTAYVELMRDEGAQPKIEQAVQRAQQHGLTAQRAAQLRGRPARPEPEREDKTEPPFAPTDADCIRFASLFAGREDVHARQWSRSGGETGYSPVHEPLTPAVVRNHLLGTFTVGVYPIRLDGTATWFALDLDITKPALERARADRAFAQSLRQGMHREGVRLLLALRELGFEPLFENSGYKGRHYWVFLQQPEEAKVLHHLGRLLLACQAGHVPDQFQLEFFPKQAQRHGKGLGNLIKLPLGIHRRTGYRSTLLDDTGSPLDEPLESLKDLPRLPRATLYAVMEQLKAQVGSALPAGVPPVGRSPGGPAGAPEAQVSTAEPAAVAAPPPPDVAPPWTEADFETDPRVRHLLAECEVLAALKGQVDEHRRLNHDEQVVLTHTLGHVEGGPQAVNYLFSKCVDVGAEQCLKSLLKGNPISCPSIRKKIGHLTRRVSCQCAFEFASDRYPTPVLHLMTLPPPSDTPEPAASTAAPDVSDPETLARRFGVLERRRREIEQEWKQLHDALCTLLRRSADRSLACDTGRYRLVERDGVEELVWEPEADAHAGDH